MGLADRENTYNEESKMGRKEKREERDIVVILHLYFNKQSLPGIQRIK